MYIENTVFFNFYTVYWKMKYAREGTCSAEKDSNRDLSGAS